MKKAAGLRGETDKYTEIPRYRLFVQLITKRDACEGSRATDWMDRKSSGLARARLITVSPLFPSVELVPTAIRFLVASHRDAPSPLPPLTRHSFSLSLSFFFSRHNPTTVTDYPLRRVNSNLVNNWRYPPAG